MPYKSKSELPDAIKDNLPDHAQEIWKEAYNSAHEQYKDETDDIEERAARVAWSAVKNKYEKDDSGEWVEKDE